MSTIGGLSFSGFRYYGTSYVVTHVVKPTTDRPYASILYAGATATVYKSSTNTGPVARPSVTRLSMPVYTMPILTTALVPSVTDYKLTSIAALSVVIIDLSTRSSLGTLTVIYNLIYRDAIESTTHAQSADINYVDLPLLTVTYTAVTVYGNITIISP